MSRQLESDPARGIVDIDTFAYHVIGYTTSLKAHPPRKVVFDDKDELRELLASELEEFPNVETALSRSMLRLENCPWQFVPESIQAVIKKGYAAVDLPDRKYVDVIFDGGSILFNLISPVVKGDLDTFSETHVEMGLQVSDDPIYLYCPIGNWFIDKTPARVKLAGRGKTADERREILSKIPPLREIFPHTLPQLHDLARFFHQSIGNAVVIA